MKGGLKKEMKINCRKIASVLASGVMLASTVGFAAAASYPMPFVNSGTADSAIVYGAAAQSSDIAAAIDVQTNLQALVTTGDGGETVIEGTSWKVSTSSDPLEIGESLADVATYIDDSDFPLLMDGDILNEKGTAEYEQFLYLSDTTSSTVNYTTDDSSGDDVIGLFFKVASGQVIAEYVIEFTSALKSDVDTSDNTYEDIEDEEINILGKTYTITKALNSSSTASDLTLMSGAAKGTVSNDETVTLDGREVSVVVSASNAAQFTVDGESTNKLAEGDTYQLSDGNYLGVSDITYQNFAGGLMQATIYVGADKLFLDDGGNLQVNAETISDASVTITESFSAGDVSITEINISMTAEDDLYVGEGGKLSEAGDLDEPEVLLTQNWDIEFAGLETYESEEVKLTPTGSDKKYELTFNNYNGDTITLPLVWQNDTGLYGGEKDERFLVLNPSANTTQGQINITKNDYFILNTADPRSATNDARSFVVQYKGSDKVTDTSPKAKFDILGVETGREMTVDSNGNFSLRIGGSTFNFGNLTNGAANDFDIMLNGDSFVDYVAADYMSIFMRTENNALINITDYNYTYEVAGPAQYDSNWEITVTIDDGNRDGDDVDVTSANEIPLIVTFANASAADVTATVNILGDEQTDPDNTDLVVMQTQHGVYIESEDPSASPATITMTIPDAVVEPLVYFTSGDVTITPGSTGGAGGQVLVIKDNEVSSVSSKNLIVVGGSCVNTVAAQILGSDTPLCESAWTEKTQAGAGQYIIKTVASPVAAADSGKVAMLVAGYNAADTTSAVAKLLETGAEISSDVDTEQVYPIVSA